MSKEAAASPTVSQEAIFVAPVNKAHEGRKVAVIDISGALLYAEKGEHIVMVLKVKLTEMMAVIEPQLYRKYIMTDRKGQSMVYIKIQKALYGILTSALLFYKKLVKDLEQQGFQLNPYEPCVTNKMIVGSQMTIT